MGDLAARDQLHLREDVAGALARRQVRGGERLLVARVDQDRRRCVIALRNHERRDDGGEDGDGQHRHESLAARLEGEDVLAEIHMRLPRKALL